MARVLDLLDEDTRKEVGAQAASQRSTPFSFQKTTKIEAVHKNRLYKYRLYPVHPVSFRLLLRVNLSVFPFDRPIVLWHISGLCARAARALPLGRTRPVQPAGWRFATRSTPWLSPRCLRPEAPSARRLSCLLHRLSSCRLSCRRYPESTFQHCTPCSRRYCV